MQALNVMGEIGQVTGYLHAEFACRTQDKELGLQTVNIGLLDYRDTLCGGLAGTGLG